MKIAFGRCNLPHKGHVHLISKVNLFILSNSKQCISATERLGLLKELNAEMHKIIIVEKPFGFLSKLKRCSCEGLVVVCEKENVALPNYFNLEVELFERDDEDSPHNISSTELRKLYRDHNDLFRQYYGTDSKYQKAVKCIQLQSQLKK